MALTVGTMPSDIKTASTNNGILESDMSSWNESSLENESQAQEYAAEQLSAYYLELEGLLERVDNSLTHYQVLGVDRVASGGEIKCAYLRAAALLNPSQFNLGLSVPDALLDRADQTFERVSRAFATLVSFHRRSEYDEELREKRTSEELVEALDEAARARSPEETDAKPRSTSKVRGPNDVETFQSFEGPSERGADRRRYRRFKLSLPVIVTGHEPKTGKWKELTRTIDVSQGGVLLELATGVTNGRVLHLAMPMPAELRDNTQSAPGYCVYAQVRRVEPSKSGRRAVALELLGEEPPEGFDAKPWATFDPNKWTGHQRRGSSRHERPEPVTIEYLSEAMKLVGEEHSFAENISSTGLRICVRSIPSEFELVRVRCEQQDFESLAAVSNRYVGEDGRERLCLRLLNNRWPLRT